MTSGWGTGNCWLGPVPKLTKNVKYVTEAFTTEVFGDSTSKTYVVTCSSCGEIASGSSNVLAF